MKKGLKIFLVILICMLIIFLIGILVYFNFNKKDTSDDNTKYDVVIKNDDYVDNVSSTNANALRDNTKQEDGVLVNNSSKIFEEHSSDGVKVIVESIKLSKDDSRFATIVFTIDTTNNKYSSSLYTLSFIDKDNNYIGNVFLESSKVSGTAKVKISTYERIIDAYDYKFVNYDESGPTTGIGG